MARLGRAQPQRNLLTKAAAAPDVRGTYMQRGVAVEINPSTGYDAFGGMCQRHNGDLIVVHRDSATQHALESATTISKATSSDYGATWTAATQIVAGTAGRDLREALIIRLQTADYLLLAYTDANSAGHDSTNAIRFRLSTDDGATWGASTTLTYSGQGNGFGIITCRPIQLPSGRILVAIRVDDSGDTHDNTEVYYSDNNGSTWAHLARAGDGDAMGHMAAEPSLTRWPDGEIWCLMRDATAEETWIAKSTDNGATWDTPVASLTSNSAAPRAAYYDGKIFLLGRDDDRGEFYTYVWWTTQSRPTSWYGPWVFQETQPSTQIANYGDMIATSDGNLYGVWFEQTGANDSDIFFNRIASRVSEGQVLVGDSFDRADGALGDMDGGAGSTPASRKRWSTALGSGTLAIVSNEITNSHATLLVEARTALLGLTNWDITVDLRPTNSFVGLRMSDSSAQDGYQVQLRPTDTPDSIKLYRLDAGVATQIGIFEQTVTPGTMYKVRWKRLNGAFTVWIDDIQLITATDATYSGPAYSCVLITLDDVEGNTCTADNLRVAYVPEPPVLTPITLALTTTLYAPTVTVTANQTVTPSIAELVLATFAPTVTATAHQTVTPTTATLTTELFAPTVTASGNQSVTPTTLALTLTAFEPTVSVSGNQSVTPTTLALVLTTFAPTVTATANQSVTPTTAALAITTFEPTVTAGGNVSVTPTTATLTLTTFAPSVSVTGNQSVTPTTAAITIATFAPTISTTQHQLVTPTTATLVITGFAPTITAALQPTDGWITKTRYRHWIAATSPKVWISGSR